jgi:hypothetical protein
MNAPLLRKGHEKRYQLEYLTGKLEYIRKTIKSDDLTRSEAHTFKILWFKAYSIHGRKFGLFSN